MSHTIIWNIIQALSAFKSRRRRHANCEEALRQIKRFPPHLLADVRGDDPFLCPSTAEFL